MSDLSLARRIEELYREERTGVLVTFLSSADAPWIGTRMLAVPDASGSFKWSEFSGMMDLARRAPDALERLLEDCQLLAESTSPEVTRLRRALVSDDDLVLLELIHGGPDLIICGAGHIGQALAPLALFLDMRVTVVDDREDYVDRRLFADPGVRLIVDPFEAGLQKVPIRPSSSIVIVTRAHKNDERCLRVVLDSPARFIGMIGSRRRVLLVLRNLEEDGYSPDRLARVRAPVGLDIGAQSPAEVALSILAEMISVKHGGTGAPKSYERKGIDRSVSSG